MKKLSVSVLKDISDNNYEKFDYGYSIDVDAMLNEHPNLTELEVFDTCVYRGIQKGKDIYEVLFENPNKKGYPFLSQMMIKKQVRQVEKLTSLKLI